MLRITRTANDDRHLLAERGQARQVAVELRARRLDQLGERLAGDQTETQAPAVIEVGQRVRIPNLGLIGNVVEVRGDKLVALAEGMRLNLTRASVRSLDQEPTDAAAPVPVGTSEGQHTEAADVGHWTWQAAPAAAAHEIDLRGETGEDGWQRLDKLIDRAIPAGLAVVHVIHGFGTGRLRDHLYGCLKRDPRVKSFAEAPPNQGGGGATQVTLSDH